jgi:hypothetical protein
MAVLPQTVTAPFSGHVIVNGIDLTGVDLSHGLVVSNTDGHIVVNGMDFTAPAAMTSLTFSQATDIGAAADASSGNGGVEIRGVFISGIDASSGAVVLDNAATGSAEAGSSVMVGGDATASAMAVPMAMAAGVPAFDLHLAPPMELHLPVFSLDWMLH